MPEEEIMHSRSLPRGRHGVACLPARWSVAPDSLFPGLSLRRIRGHPGRADGGDHARRPGRSSVLRSRRSSATPRPPPLAEPSSTPRSPTSRPSTHCLPTTVRPCRLSDSSMTHSLVATSVPVNPRPTAWPTLGRLPPTVAPTRSISIRTRSGTTARTLPRMTCNSPSMRWRTRRSDPPIRRVFSRRPSRGG